VGAAVVRSAIAVIMLTIMAVNMSAVMVPGVVLVMVCCVIVPAGDVSGMAAVGVVAVGSMVMARAVAAAVPMAPSPQVKDQEDRAGGEQDAADDEVGVTGDAGAELETDTDHDSTDDQGHHDVRDGGGQRQAHYLARAVLAGAGQDRQRQPVIRHDRVPKADAGRGEQDDRKGVHAPNHTHSYSHQ
jgi:hypothetical protein